MNEAASRATQSHRLLMEKLGVKPWALSLRSDFCNPKCIYAQLMAYYKDLGCKPIAKGKTEGGSGNSSGRRK